MRIIFDVGHPAQVHFFKHAVRKLQDRGHETAITCGDKDVTIALLKSYGMPYHVIGRSRRGLVRLFFEMVVRDIRLLRFARTFKPDVLVGGCGNVTAPTVARLLRKPSIVFDDTEHSKYEHFLMDRLATLICTPACYKKDLGAKQLRYDGYHPLAYLHYNYFRPDPSVLGDVGLAENERFVVVRFVSWAASHDVARHGFIRKREFVERLSEHARVLVSSESAMDEHLEKYRLRVPPQKLHSLLHYASLSFGDGGTTAVESALLGTPTVHYEYARCKDGKYSTTQDIGVFDELVNRYGLVRTFSDEDEAIEESLSLIRNRDSKAECGERARRVFENKIDVTAFMVDLIENCHTVRVADREAPHEHGIRAYLGAQPSHR